MTDGPPPKVVVLISGRGTNLQALIDAEQAGELHGTIHAVFSDHIDAKGLERAAQNSKYAWMIKAHSLGASLGRYQSRFRATLLLRRK